MGMRTSVTESAAMRARWLGATCSGAIVLAYRPWLGLRKLATLKRLSRDAKMAGMMIQSLELL